MKKVGLIAFQKNYEKDWQNLISKMYYFAYGTNINSRIFLKRYKNSKKIKIYTLKNFQLEFRTKYGVPDIKKKTGKKVIGIIYCINLEDLEV